MGSIQQAINYLSNKIGVSNYNDLRGVDFFSPEANESEKLQELQKINTPFIAKKKRSGVNNQVLSDFLQVNSDSFESPPDVDSSRFLQVEQPQQKYLLSKERKRIIGQLVLAIDYIHAEDIVAGNINPQTISIEKRDEKIHCQLFGLDKIQRVDDIAAAKAKDIFDLGLTLLSIVDYSLAEKMIKEVPVGRYADFIQHNGFAAPIVRGFHLETDPLKKAIKTKLRDLDHDLKNLIIAMLNPDPKARITVAMMKEHAYFKQGEVGFLAGLDYDFADSKYTEGYALAPVKKDSYKKPPAEIVETIRLTNDFCSELDSFHESFSKAIIQPVNAEQIQNCFIVVTHKAEAPLKQVNKLLTDKTIQEYHTSLEKVRDSIHEEINLVNSKILATKLTVKPSLDIAPKKLFDIIVAACSAVKNGNQSFIANISKLFNEWFYGDPAVALNKIMAKTAHRIMLLDEQKQTLEAMQRDKKNEEKKNKIMFELEKNAAEQKKLTTELYQEAAIIIEKGGPLAETLQQLLGSVIEIKKLLPIKQSSVAPVFDRKQELKPVVDFS